MRRLRRVGLLALSSLLQSPRETAILALSTSSLWRKPQRERPCPQFGWPTEDAACWARTAKIGADGWPRARQWKLSALAERRSRWFNQLLERLTSAWMLSSTPPLLAAWTGHSRS